MDGGEGGGGEDSKCFPHGFFFNFFLTDLLLLVCKHSLVERDNDGAVDGGVQGQLGGAGDDGGQDQGGPAPGDAGQQHVPDKRRGWGGGGGSGRIRLKKETGRANLSPFTTYWSHR